MVLFEIFWTARAKVDFARLRGSANLAKRYRAVKKAIKLLSSNPRHPGLQTHEFTSLKGPDGEKVFEAYAEQNTPAAYRVFWCYGPGTNQITIIAIVRHP
jgi:hypothetical protein